MGDEYLRLTAIAAAQHGVFSRAQALECGVTSTMLTRRTRNGALVRPYEGVYVVAGSPGSWLRAVATAVLGAGAGAVASHATACHLLDLAKRPRTIEVTVPRDARPRRDYTIHRSTDLIETDVFVVAGIRCTTPARTLVDVGILGAKDSRRVAWTKRSAANWQPSKQSRRYCTVSPARAGTE